MCFSSNLDSFFAQEVGSSVQHVRSVRGVVVGVGGVVAGLNELQPGAQRRLRAVQELTHAEGGEDLQPEESQRSARDHTKARLNGRHVFERRAFPYTLPNTTFLFASPWYLVIPYPCIVFFFCNLIKS